MPIIFAMAVVASTAHIALPSGQAMGPVSVVTTLESVASAVSVSLARVFIKQPVAPRGGLGIAAMVGGLFYLQAYRG